MRHLITPSGAIQLDPDEQTSNGSGTRPAGWIDMPALANDVVKIVMLVAVYQHGSNFSAFKAVGGGYTVDWGDGNATEDYNSNAQAEKNLVYDNYSSSTDSGLGYRQALVTITPQAGQTLTSAYLSQKHSVPQYYYSQTLEVVMSGASWTHLTFLGAAYSSSMRFFEFFGTCNLVNCYRMFHVCVGLKKITLPDMPNCTTLSELSTASASLEALKIGATPLVTDTTQMLYKPYAVQSVECADLSGVTASANMLYQHKSLGKLTLTNMASDIDVSYGKLSAAELNSFFESLGADLTGVTVTVTGNWGATACDASIVTSRGGAVITL